MRMWLVLAVATIGGMLWPLLPTEQSISLSSSMEDVAGTSDSVRLAVGIAAIVLAALSFGLAWFTKERRTGTPTTFVPPNGYGPVQTVFCAWETVGQHAIPASLLHLSNLGLVKIDTVERGTLRFTRIADDTQWKAADRISRFAAERAGLTARGATMEPTLGIRTTKEFARANSRVLEAARSWSVQAGLSAISPLHVVGRTLWFASLAAAAVLFTGIAGPTMYGLPFAAFALAGFGMTAVGYLHVRTPAGRQAWAQSEGFSRLLSTPSNEKRIAYSVDRVMQPNFLAYAMAFNVATRWQESYLELSPILQTAIDLERQVDLGRQVGGEPSGADDPPPT